jgi:hypothetical protein
LVPYSHLADVSDVFPNQVLNVTGKGGVGEGAMAVIAVVDRGLTESAIYPDLSGTNADIAKLRSVGRRKVICFFQGGTDDRAALALLARCVNDLSTTAHLVQVTGELDEKDVIALEQVKSDPAVTFVESGVDTALLSLTPFGRDVIIVGRHSSEGLGPVAVCLLDTCPASLLVVQGRLGLD